MGNNWNEDGSLVGGLEEACAAEVDYIIPWTMRAGLRQADALNFLARSVHTPAPREPDDPPTVVITSEVSLAMRREIAALRAQVDGLLGGKE